MPAEVRVQTTADRRTIAPLFGQPDEDQLDPPSPDGGRTYRDLLGHLVMSSDLGFPRLVLERTQAAGPRVSGTVDLTVFPAQHADGSRRGRCRDDNDTERHDREEEAGPHG